MKRDYIKLVSVTITISFLAACSFAQPPNPPAANTAPPPLPQFVNGEKPTVYSIDPKTLPPPYHTESARRNSRVIAQPSNAKLFVPNGFKVNVFAEGGFTYPRWMAAAPNGDIFLADSRANSVIVLRDKNKDGIAEERFVF